PASFDVTRLLRAGKNVIAADAYNEDGPAGLLMDLAGFSDTGQVVLDVITDKTWKVAEAPAVGWINPDFDDLHWDPAKQIADVGGGYWESKLRTDYQAQEYQLRVPENTHPAVSGI